METTRGFEHRSRLTFEDRQRILVDWTNTRRDYPLLRVHELFESQVDRAPNSIALIMNQTKWTYEELNAYANRIARDLQSYIVERQTPVGLCLERSPKLIATMLAVLKVGGVYVPIDPSYPHDRRLFLIKDSGVRVLVTERPLIDLSPDTTGIPVIPLSESHSRDATDLDRCGSPDDIAYVLYTSGSTGRPKGVEILHRGIVRLLFNVDYVSLGPNETFLQMAPISFDASTFEIWGPLLHGGTCVLYPERIPTPAGIREEIRRNGITTMWLTASLFHHIMDESPDALRGLGQLLVGGETVSPSHVKRALLALPETHLINGYGPTESTTFACCHEVIRGSSDYHSSIPIGRPIANTRVYILNSALEPVPVGAVGEIFIGGDGLARGYRNLPELTKEKFIPDPFIQDVGTRLYRTGDLAKWRPNGDIEFLGRIDRQVKIHGFRVELGEVEAVMRAVAGVNLAAVIVREPEERRKQLCAFYEGSASVEEVRNNLKHKLPEYSRPQFVLRLPRLPLLPSGKIDHGALATEPIDIAVSSSEAPRTETEWIIHRMMADLLHFSEFGRRDNFFDIGADSLDAIQLTTQIAEVLGVELPASVVVQAPTVEALTEIIANSDGGCSVRGLIPLKRSELGLPLFCIHGMDGSVWMYRRLVRYLPDKQQVYGLEALELDQSASLSIECLAQRHIDEMKRSGFHAPYQICGFSYGGVVAYEMACQLEAAGEKVALLALIDSSAYDLRGAWSQTEITTNFLRRFRKRLRALIEGEQTVGAYAMNKWRFWMARGRTILSHKEDHVLRWLSNPGEVLTGRQSRFVTSVQPDAVRPLMSALSRYVPNGYSGKMTLLKPAIHPSTDLDLKNGWSKFVRGNIEVCLVPGDHLSMLDEDAHVRVLANELSRIIASATR